MSSSLKGSEPSQAWAFQFSSWNRADKSSKILTLIINFNQIFQFCAFTIIITSNSAQIQDQSFIWIYVRQKAFFELNTIIQLDDLIFF